MLVIVLAQHRRIVTDLIAEHIVRFPEQLHVISVHVRTEEPVPIPGHLQPSAAHAHQDGSDKPVRSHQLTDARQSQQHAEPTESASPKHPPLRQPEPHLLDVFVPMDMKVLFVNCHLLFVPENVKTVGSVFEISH